MLWSEDPRPGRRALLAGLASLAAVSLGGCFRPMLAEGETAAELRGRIALPPVDSRFEYHMREVLEARLGAPQDPDLQLEVRTRITEDDLAITPDSAITRKSLTARANYTLRPRGGGAALTEGQVVSQAGYNSTASLYATRSIRRDTEDRLAKDLGERIARRVLAGAERLAPS